MALAHSLRLYYCFFLSIFTCSVSNTIFLLCAGFTKGWQLALVMLSVVPLLGISAGLLFRSIGQLTQLGQKLYAEVRETHSSCFKWVGWARRQERGDV
jgi:ABC-type multidrug transport system fused ATPase/permease subunit